MGSHEGEKVKRTDDGLVVVDPKPLHSSGFFSFSHLERVAINTLEDTAVSLYGKWLQMVKGKKLGRPYFLTGNFGPIKGETSPVDVPVIRGHLPKCLNGQYMRVGPNPQVEPCAHYAWLDGDGMVHGIRIQDGKAKYLARYIETSRFLQEKHYERATFFKYGDMKGFFGMFAGFIYLLREKLGVVDASYGWGNADTTLVYHNKKLMALHEQDKPYVLKVNDVNGDLVTSGMLDYNGKLQHFFTAHPKIDPVTGELFTFGCSQSPPYVTYRVVSKDGVMNDPVTIRVSGPTMMHDFAITKNYVIFMDLPFYFNPVDMIKDDKPIYNFDTTKNSRFGILPRYAKDDRDIKWFENPNGYIFHNANAWEDEENDEVVLISFQMKTITLMTDKEDGDILSTFDNVGTRIPMQYETLSFDSSMADSSSYKLKLMLMDPSSEPEPPAMTNYSNYKSGPELESEPESESESEPESESESELDSKPEIESDLESESEQMPDNVRQKSTCPLLFSSIEETEEKDYTIPHLYEMRFNLKTGKARCPKKLSKAGVDFPRVNESLIGRKTRYVYATEFEGAKITSINKYDLEAPCKVREQKFILGDGKYGSEPVFVPRQIVVSKSRTHSSPPLEEDDGYLICFVHDEKASLKGKSYLYVINAKTMHHEPVAVIELPKRVPYGFHAAFITDEQIRQQRTLAKTPRETSENLG